jgi:hypothetical protein
MNQEPFSRLNQIGYVSIFCATLEAGSHHEAQRSKSISIGQQRNLTSRSSPYSKGVSSRDSAKNARRSARQRLLRVAPPEAYLPARLKGFACPTVSCLTPSLQVVIVKTEKKAMSSVKPKSTQKAPRRVQKVIVSCLCWYYISPHF